MAFDAQTYQSWRNTFEFTNEEVARQFEADAEVARQNGSDFLAERYLRRASQVRAGYLSSKDIRHTVGGLVQACAICGKKALYRYGSSGRCAEHKSMVHSAVQARRDRLNKRSEAISMAADAKDAFLRKRDMLRRLKESQR